MSIERACSTQDFRERASEATIGPVGTMTVDRWAVLIVEDDDALRGTLVESLRDCGLQVEAARAADASIDAWRGDVIVTDTFASPYNTKAVVAYLSELRSRFEAGIVVLSGHNGVARDGAQLPADAVVMKPFDLDRLLAVIATVAGNRQTRGTQDGDRAAAR